MPSKTERVPVIFRKFRDGDVIAIFPTLPGTCDPSTCLTYQHVGQHGSGGEGLLMASTSPCSEAESEPLRRELERIGYVLSPKKRTHYSHYLARRAAIVAA